jgi:hypothetical protein
MQPQASANDWQLALRLSTSSMEAHAIKKHCAAVSYFDPAPERGFCGEAAIAAHIRLLSMSTH